MENAIQFGFIVLLFGASIIANRNKNRGKSQEEYFLKQKSLNWFLIAFSAGTTANTGFIVTAAIAMGYSMGLAAAVLPVSFFFGDLIFWKIFAQRIFKYAEKNEVKTIPEFITNNINGNAQNLRIIISICIVLSAILYTIAQWNAAGKIFSSFYAIDPRFCITVFSVIVLSYCIIGGFISSVYADIVQGVFMLLLATVSVSYCIIVNENILNVFNQLLNQFDIQKNIFSINGLIFIVGWAIASIGFSFSQPHIIDKIYAGKDESSIKKAKYTYIFFVQYTWLGMTVLGMLLKSLGENYGNADNEKVLATFIAASDSGLLKGIVITGVFATIASTAASLNISISNYLMRDIIRVKQGSLMNRFVLVAVFICTVVPSIYLVNENVFDLTIFAVSLGATLSSCVLIKIFNWEHNITSLSGCIIIALAITVIFKHYGISSNILYDIPVGIVAGLITNKLIYKISGSSNHV